MRKLIFSLFSLIACLFMASQAMASQPFPDTGQTMCYDADHNQVSCDTIQPGEPLYGQDGHYQPRLPRSYTKLGHGGTILADDARHVDDGGPWIMTRDNVTGLIWELKTNDNKDDKYTWQNAQDVFIPGLNSDEFGGYDDWRLPSVTELSSLVNAAGSPWIEAAWFPKNVSSNYWSSTTVAGHTHLAWFVNFNRGYVNCHNKSYSYYVRAVRAGPPPQQSLVDHGDGTVTDTATGLMWQKCSYGQTWSDGQCTGSATTRNWQQALEAAENLTWPSNGYTDWRLPNRNELQSLVNYTRFSPAIDPVFASVSSGYWSSTTHADYPGYAWRVYFSSGYVLYGWSKSDSYFVRAVRAGESDPGSFGSLTVTSTGASSVPITATPSTYGSTTNYTKTNIPNGTQITLTAPTTSGGASFSSWSGCDATDAAERTCTVTMDDNKMVTARYDGDTPTVLPGVIMLLLDDAELDPLKPPIGIGIE